MKRYLRAGVAVAIAAAAAVVAVPAVAGAEGDGGSAPATQTSEWECNRQIDAVVAEDMESFAGFDAERWGAVHREDAVTVFAGGQVVVGRDRVVSALRNHFNDKNATWSWTEVKRVVPDGCHTAYVLFDTTYTIPSVGFYQHTMTGVTYHKENGRWLVIADHNTLLKN